MSLRFKKAASGEDFKAIHAYIADVFSDTDFNWSLEEIEGEVKSGWELWAARDEEGEVVAALFLRMEGDALLTKNSALNIRHQGRGHSHEIKEYFEKTARQRKAKWIIHFCPVDNFRAHALNEGHGYARLEGKGEVVQWKKELK